MPGHLLLFAECLSPFVHPGGYCGIKLHGCTLIVASLQNNSICSLKGSLLHFKFLETLDLSNNQLRNLPKLAASLAKFHFLTFLNLKVP